MDYQKTDTVIYLRIDKSEPILHTIETLCEKEHILAGYFQGIGACSQAILATYIPENHDFTLHTETGMLEMVSLLGNVTEKEDRPHLHAHAVFSRLTKEGSLQLAAGHLKEAFVSYTAEIILTHAPYPIRQKFDPKTGISIWHFQKGAHHESK